MMPNEKKLSHRRLAAWLATAAATAVGSGDFHEKAVKVKFWFTCDY
jgi:hypothetical protein